MHVCVVECVCIKVRSCVCLCFHFSRSGGSLQRPCPPPVIWLWQSRGDIIVCSRSSHAKQSVHVFAVCSLHRTPPLSSQCHQKADTWVWCSIIFSALWKCAHTYLFTVSESMHTLRHTLRHTLDTHSDTHSAPAAIHSLPPCPLTSARWARRHKKKY